jgi:two-component system chemotaxis response regulator CheB
MPTTDIVVLGASAGGVEALSRLVSALPADFPAAIFVVIHFPESSISALPSILSRRGPLKAKHALDGERIEQGTIYVAPPGRHMLLGQDRIRLVVGPRENGNRPAIDPLFRTAARAYGPSVIGVLLTGMLDDGTIGMSAIKRHGGVTIVQDPADAMFGDMPRNALQLVNVEYVLPLDRIAPTLAELVGRETPAWEEEDVPDQTEMDLAALQDLEGNGRPSAFVCPECKGTLFELAEDGLLHYRCRVGHTYMPDTLESEQTGVLEAALWTAFRAVKEHNALLERMISRAEARGFDASARAFRARLNEGQERISLLSRALGLSRRETAPDERSV